MLSLFDMIAATNELTVSKRHGIAALRGSSLVLLPPFILKLDFSFTSCLLGVDGIVVDIKV